MKAAGIPPEISYLIDRVSKIDKSAFCMISDRFREGGHPLPIYRVGRDGTSVECGRADVMIVFDGMVIAVDIIREWGEGAEPSSMSSGSCYYYEFKEAREPKERGPYEVAKGCVALEVTSTQSFPNADGDFHQRIVPNDELSYQTGQYQ